MLHPRIEVGIGVGSGPPLRRTHLLVRAAKAMGVRSVWTVDHLTGFFPKSVWDSRFTWLAGRGGTPDAFYDWQAFVGHLAGRVGRMQVGVGVTEAVRRHPVVLAQSALTLSHLTRRAPILGIGAGEAENITPYGLSFERPVARLAEALQILRLCFEGAPLDFAGDFFRLEGATLALSAGGAGTPRIWVGAHGPRMLELTGRFGDGWLPAVPMSPAAYATSLDQIRGAAVHHGRDPDGIVPAMTIPYVVGRSVADVETQLRHPAVRFLALLAPDRVWRAAGREHPFGSGFGGMVDFVPSRYSREQIEAGIEAVPYELLAERIVAGTPDRVVEQVRDLAHAGLRHAVLSAVSPLVSRRALALTIRTLPGIVRRLRTGQG